MTNVKSVYLSGFTEGEEAKEETAKAPEADEEEEKKEEGMVIAFHILIFFFSI